MRQWEPDAVLDDLAELIRANDLPEEEIVTDDTLQLFLRDVRRHPLLSAAQEVIAGQADRAG